MELALTENEFINSLSVAIKRTTLIRVIHISAEGHITVPPADTEPPQFNYIASRKLYFSNK